MISRSQMSNSKPALRLRGSPILKRTVETALKVLRPPPELTISDWADQNRRLSSDRPLRKAVFEERWTVPGRFLGQIACR